MQLERVTSFKLALARAIEVKVINDPTRFYKNPGNGSRLNLKDSTPKNQQSQFDQAQTHINTNQTRTTQVNANIECWLCNEKGHYQSDCPKRVN